MHDKTARNKIKNLETQMLALARLSEILFTKLCFVGGPSIEQEMIDELKILEEITPEIKD